MKCEDKPEFNERKKL